MFLYIFYVFNNKIELAHAFSKETSLNIVFLQKKKNAILVGNAVSGLNHLNIILQLNREIGTTDMKSTDERSTRQGIDMSKDRLSQITDVRPQELL